MFKKILFFIVFFGSFLTMDAQPQRSNVYVFDMQVIADTVFRFTNLRWVTQFNRNGYNNHPYFMDDNTLYLSVQLPYEKQPDLYAFNFQDRSQERVTATPEGEYSPMRAPDFYTFSAVRMVFNGTDTLLRLWQFPLDRSNNGKPVFKYINNIGYYTWINTQQVAVFITDPNAPYLGLADLRNDQVQRLATNVGRTLRMTRDGKLLFIQKSGFGTWQLMSMDPVSQQSQKIVDTLPGSEDFVLLTDGTILMANGTAIYKFKPGLDTGWVEIADFRFYNLGSITRLAVSPGNKLAMVTN